jgi:membrane-bound lytic murein transglycosylase A
MTAGKPITAVQNLPIRRCFDVRTLGLLPMNMVLTLSRFRFATSLVMAGGLVLLTGCNSTPVVEEEVAATPDYSRPLPPGQSALRLVTDPARMPDIAGAYDKKNVFLLDSIDQSLKWFAAPSSKQHFPFESFTHDQARVSLLAFKQLLEQSPDAAAFTAKVKEQFDVYESVGYNDEGIVLFTGYFAGVFNASTTQAGEYQFPLYKRPPDLATDPKTGEPLGRKTPEGTVVPYYTRAEIEQSQMFKGNELVWLDDALSAYLVHVNGSAKLRMPDNSEMYIGYNGKTDRPYYGLGRSLVENGVIPANQLSLPRIRRTYREQPDVVRDLMNRNECYVFFTQYPPDKWPAGSLGVRVSTEATLATDKKIYPRGGVVLVDTESVTLTEKRERFLRFMCDQDTGGAIRAPGRADIFMGIGSTAEIIAGGQYAEGRLYYFFLKPEFVSQYMMTTG